VYVEPFSPARTFEQELQRQRSLPGTGLPRTENYFSVSPRISSRPETELSLGRLPFILIITFTNGPALIAKVALHVE
jgi:hypothetical protein